MKTLSLGSPEGSAKILSTLSTLAALTVGAMVACIVATHSSQEFLQSARAAADVQQHFANPMTSLGLRLNLGLDDLFMVLYGAFFVMLAARYRDRLPPAVLGVALTAMLGTLALDMLENAHLATQLHQVEAHLGPTDADGAWQMVASGVKFHLSYLGVLLFSFGFETDGPLGLVIARILRLGYLPFGVMVLVWPPEKVAILALARTVFFVLAFVLSAILFAQANRQPPTST